MWFVADVSGRRKRDRFDDLPIGSGVLIEIHHGQKVGRAVGLIAGPNVKHGFGLIVSMLGKSIRRCRSCDSCKAQR